MPDQHFPEPSKRLYQHNHKPYYEAGYSVIPNPYASKKGITGWSKFCDVMPDSAQVQAWNDKLKDTNIALCLGDASKVICLDVDTNDPAILAYFDHVLTPSPAVRYGSKGFCAFYKYDERFSNNIVVNTIDGPVLELFVRKKKIVLPPSKHPDGMDYRWEGKALHHFKPNELPKINRDIINGFIRFLMRTKGEHYIVGKYGKTGVTKESAHLAHGRNNVMKDIVVKYLQTTDMPLQNLAQLLVEEDLKLHPDNPLFGTQYEDGNPTSCALINALRFVNSILISVASESYNNKKEIIHLARPIFTPEKKVIVAVEPSNEELISIYQKNYSKKVNVPQGHGLVGKIQDLLVCNASKPQPALSLASALASVSALSARKWVFLDNTSNLYQIMVAPAGSGKDINLKFPYKLLAAVGGTARMGCSDYGSHASFIEGISGQPARLDCLDEVHGLLNQDGSPHMQELKNYLLQFYSFSTDYYAGRRTVKDGLKGACAMPNISLLGATTPESINTALSGRDAKTGLLPRTLLYMTEDVDIVFKDSSLVIPEDILDTARFLKNYVGTEQTVQNSIVHFDILDCSPSHFKIFKEISREIESAKKVFDSDDPMFYIMARSYQQFCKLVMNSAIGNVEEFDFNPPQVTEKDITFAYDVVKHVNQNYQTLFETKMVVKSPIDLRKKVFNLIKKNESMTDRDLKRKLKNHYSARQIANALEECLQLNELISVGGDGLTSMDVSYCLPN